MGNIRLYLRPNEKLYINGAVIRFDRKVSLELLNDVTFLLESHVMQAEDASTPLRQLYFVVQMMLINPADTQAARKLFDSMLMSMSKVLENESLRAGIGSVEEDVRSGKEFNALKTLRKLFATEDAILGKDGARATAGDDALADMAMALAK